MKRTVPLLITAISGLILIVAFFIPATQSWGENAAVWFDILASIAFVLGGGNLLKMHLKKVSDKEEGWGYSGITVVAFLVTLGLGLSKLGSRPAEDAESYGQSAVPLNDYMLPVYSVDGSIPKHPDDEPLPASVREQFYETDNGQLNFRGWMTVSQKNELLSHYQTLNWQCTVHKLHAASQPPKELPKLGYSSDQVVLTYEGYVSNDVEAELYKLLGESEEATLAIQNLAFLGRQPHAIDSDHIPESLDIPEAELEYLTLEADKLTLNGPMTTKLRGKLARAWCHYPVVRPVSVEKRAEFQQELEALGNQLTQKQQAAWTAFFAGDWNAAQLTLVINAAGTEIPKEKSPCELQEEMVSGVTNIELKKSAPEPVTLNDEQKRVIELFASNPEQTLEEFSIALGNAGVVTENQNEAIRDFFNKLPTVAEQKRDLCFELLRYGALTTEQQEFLLSDFRGQYAWQKDVGNLFIASHRVRYPWSGKFSEQGNPFWWVYEYIFKPLLTTTFAMLAFYVASAAFRAFRAKNLEATLLLGTAFIILLGRTFAGAYLTGWIPDALSAFRIDQMVIHIMSIFNTAGNRAIMIGIALGIASTSLKVMLGVDRSYLGSGDDS